MEHTIFCQNIKALRMKFGYRQEDVAAALGVTRAAYTYKEGGKVQFSINELPTLAKLFGVEIADLFVPWHIPHNCGKRSPRKPATDLRKLYQLSPKERSVVAALRVHPEKYTSVLHLLQGGKR